MKEIYGDIVKLIRTGKYDAACVTTNSVIKKNGEAVMGRGVALRFRELLPWLPITLANRLRAGGNHVHTLERYLCTDVLSFPTKEDWKNPSDIQLIKQSCEELMTIIADKGYSKVLLPRPGCSNGGLEWDDVKPIISPILDDRVYVIQYEEAE